MACNLALSLSCAVKFGGSSIRLRARLAEQLTSITKKIPPGQGRDFVSCVFRSELKLQKFAWAKAFMRYCWIFNVVPFSSGSP